jgi:hypothetical protein
MSRQLPAKPNLEYLKKQAKELLRNGQHGKLADAQRALASEYGFARWADLKAHVQALSLTPAEALKAAVCDCNAARVREVLKQHPELRARIDDPLPDYVCSAKNPYTANLVTNSHETHSCSSQHTRGMLPAP